MKPEIERLLRELESWGTPANRQLELRGIILAHIEQQEIDLIQTRERECERAGKVILLEKQIAALTAERDKYKEWYLRNTGQRNKEAGDGEL